MALNFKKVHAIILLSLVIASHCGKDWSDDQNPKKWNDYSRQRIDKMLTRKLNGNVAKNIILFLGDGMGITTVTVRALFLHLIMTISYTLELIALFTLIRLVVF